MRYAFLLLFVPLLVFGYESDQYTQRTQEVSDSLRVMDRAVNDSIASILARKKPPTTQAAMARAIYYDIGGHYWADKIERWAAKSAEVEKYHQSRYQSIYRSMPIWATRVNFLFGIGRSFRVNDVMVGSDKFGHFVSQGYKYYKRDIRGLTDEELLARGWFAERWLFGQLTTGVFSNADLVANYEGWRFFQSLFNDEVISDKPAILMFKAGKIVQQREFTWADHINDYWDEALNPSFMVPSLNKRLRKKIAALCPDYEKNRSAYSTQGDAELWGRYKFLGLKDNRANHFTAICTPG